MPDIYIHHGIGSTEFDSGNLSERISATSGSTYTITAHPKSGWKFVDGEVDGAKYPYSPFSFTVKSVDMNVYTSFSQISAPPPPPPPPPGEEIIGTVGQSCDIMRKYMFGQPWYRYQQRYTGESSSWDSKQEDTEYEANGNPSCFAPPPPPPKTVDDVSKEVDILRGLFNSVNSRLQDVLTALQEEVRQRTQAITDLTIAVQQEAKDRYKAIIDLEARIRTLTDGAIKAALAPVIASIDALKAWITESVFELLMKNLDAGTREWRKKQI